MFAATIQTFWSNFIKHILHLEYCSQIWNPTSKKIILKFVKVQKTFTKLVCGWSQQGNCERPFPSYRDRIELLGLRSLLPRRAVADGTSEYFVASSNCVLASTGYSALVSHDLEDLTLTISWSKKRTTQSCSTSSLIVRLAGLGTCLPRLQSDSSNISRYKLDRIDILQVLEISNSCI